MKGMSSEKIEQLLGRSEAQALLGHRCVVPRERLHLPGPDFVSRVLASTDRSCAVLRNIQSIFDHGRLAGTGYLSILPVDQGVEHGAGVSFAANPDYFDPENIVSLAIEGGCNAVASSLGVLGAVARGYAHRIPFIVKLNHNELLSFPEKHDQTPFASVEQAFSLGAVAVGATVYFGSAESRRQIEEVSRAFGRAHELGMATFLWAYLRNERFRAAENDYHRSADLTGQANYLAATIEADFIKQKQPTTDGGLSALGFSQRDDRIYSELSGPNPVDMTRYQVVNCFMGRVGLINSGGVSTGDGDLAEAVRTAVINKRAGGMGLITGRKAFQKPAREGVALLNAIQDVYLSEEITVA